MRRDKTEAMVRTIDITILIETLSNLFAYFGSSNHIPALRFEALSQT